MAARVFELLPAKLGGPTRRPGDVERRRLVARVCAASSRRIVSVVAPPGSGKTTFLGQWAARDRRAFAWASLDHRDNDLVVFLRYIAAALNADSTLDPAVITGLRGSRDALWARGLPRLGAALADRTAPLVLVLDDAHELVDRECLDALAVLVQHLPCGSQLVLCGRAEVGLGLAKLRVDGDLLELGPEALALDDAEARALLSGAGADMTDAQAAALNERAEGWAAGLCLAALSLEESGSSIASFGGDDRFVAEYLRAEVLTDIEPELLEFVLRTAVLEPLCASLCDAVLERDDSAQMLERLECTNHFVLALDGRRRWFRYHRLFREMLRAELARRSPELPPILNRRASAWCLAHGLPEVALEYAAAAGEPDELAALVGTLAFAQLQGGRMSMVERWLTPVSDPALLRRHPALAALGVWAYAVRGRPEAADRCMLALESARAEHEMPDGSPLEAWAATLRAVLARRGVSQMEADAERALSLLPAASPWRPVALVLRGMAVLFSGDPEGALPILGDAAEEAAAGGVAWAGVVARSERALLALERGDLDAAEAEAALAEGLMEGTPSPDRAAAAILLAATAKLAIAQGQGARVRSTLAVAGSARPLMTHALPWLAVHARLELAKAHLAVSDVAGAAMLSREADEILRRRSRLGTLVSEAQAVRAKLSSTSPHASGRASTLTAAELRLLPLLTTHLSFREIAERRFVSSNTVKTQAISAYRKLGASTRSEAIDRAIALGLIDAPVAFTEHRQSPAGALTVAGASLGASLIQWRAT